MALVCDVYYDFVTFPFGILGRVWYLIVWILDPCYVFLLSKEEGKDQQSSTTPDPRYQMGK